MTNAIQRGQSASRLTLRSNLISVALALFIAGLVLLVYQAISLRAALFSDASLQASVIAENVSAQLMFDDEHATREVLRSLAKVPYVESVSVYRNDARLFTRYARAGISASEQEDGTLAAADSHETLSLGDVIVRASVSQNGRKLGDVVLVATTDLMRGQLSQYAVFLGVASLCAVWISSIVAKRMQRRVTKAEQELEYLARTDSLTELPNRRAFYETLHARLKDARPLRRRVGLILVDLDDFKPVNDTLGHAAGDELLGHVATILKSISSDGAIPARMGGDEFAVIVAGNPTREEIDRLSWNLVDAIARAVVIADREVMISASVGYAIFPQVGETEADLMSSADIALYEAKKEGKNITIGFRPDMLQAAHRRAYLQRELRRAVEADDLELVYQPQYNCQNGALIGAEVLARWQHPREGAISPGEFIPIAESSDLIVQLGRAILQRACVAAATWNANVAGQGVRVAVNVSARQFKCPGFVSDVRAALRLSGLRADLLELELTESHLLASRETAVAVMNQLRAVGVQLSLDDFGTGYSSLAYLHAFPVDTLKIDRSFVERIPDEGQPIVTAILSMAHSFGLQVVAEGVEEPAQLAWLIEAGCDIVQGYLTGRPMSLEAFRAVIDKSERGVTSPSRLSGEGRHLSAVR